MKPRILRTAFLILVLALAAQSGAVLGAPASGLPLAGLRQPAAPAAVSILVTTTTDELNSDGDCSLREAIRAANLNVVVDACPAGSAASADIITLQSAATYSFSQAGTDDTAIDGDLDIAGDLILKGANATVQAGTTTANGIDRVFQVLSGNEVAMEALTIRHGRTSSFGAGIRTAGDLTLEDVTVTLNTSTGNVGGGIAVEAGSLTLINSTVSSNTAATVGGGLALLGGSLTMVGGAISSNTANTDRGGGLWVGTNGGASLLNCTISGNTADTNGGGIYNENNLDLFGCTIHSNQAGTPGGGVGGGIYNLDSLTIKHSTIRDNDADDSAGINNDGGVMNIKNSTISGNQAISAGGLRNQNSGVANLVNTTVSSNSATAGAGGIANGSGSTLNLSSVTIAFNAADSDASDFGDGGGLNNAATVVMRNSLLGENTDGTVTGNKHHDCTGGFTSAGYNLIENTTGCAIGGDTTGNVTGIDPNLAAVASNGGRTQTNAFPTGAPPHNAGNPAGCLDHNGSAILEDQRDGARLNRCDQGAFEFAACLVIGDVDGDGDVDGSDLALVSAAWSGRLAYNPVLDVVVDGLINAKDLQAVAARFGLACS